MPETVGIYYRDEEMDELEEFDEVSYRHQDGRYSRSQAVRESMRMRKTVLETMEELDWPEMSEHDRRAAVRQALIDADRRE